MIADKDRSGYFGASDTSFIIGNYKTKTFEKWWLIKLGLHQQELHTDAILAGNNFEGKIIDGLERKLNKVLERDKQIIIGRLRVNLDSNTEDEIYEIKTFKAEKGFKVPKNYWRQVQVQMYATGIRKAYIAAYPLTNREYNNFFAEIDEEKLLIFKIEYDEEFIKDYINRLEYLTKCLIEGRFPKNDEV